MADLASNYVTEDNITRMVDDRMNHNIQEALNSKDIGKGQNSRAQ